MGNNSFELRRICTNLRPAKVAILLHKDEKWQENCLNIIKIYSQVWGGKQNLIIPTDGNKIEEDFWFLLEKFDPDYLFIYYVSEKKDISEELKYEIINRLNPFKKDEEDPIFRFIRHGEGFYPLTYLPDIIHNVDFDENVVHLGTFYRIEANAIAKLLVYSILGNTDKLKEGLNPNQYIIDLKHAIHGRVNYQREIRYNNDNLSELMEILWNPNIKFPCHFQLSMLNLTDTFNEYDHKIKLPIVLVIGDSLEDFCLYYNMSRLRFDVLWAPYSLIKDSFESIRTKEKSYLFIQKLLKAVTDRYLHSFSEEKIAVFSSSKSEHDLQEFINMLKDPLVKEAFNYNNNAKYIEESLNYYFPSKDIYSILNYTIQNFETKNYLNCYMEQFVDGKSINPVNTPIPINFKNKIFKNHFWITELSIEKYKLPPKPYLNSLIVEDRDTYLHLFYYLNFLHNIRISKGGISYFCPVPMKETDIDVRRFLTQPGIVISEPFEIFERIFEESNYHIITSDKGNYERESIEKFGSLEDIAKFLTNEKYQNLFNKFIEKCNPSLFNDGIFLNDDCRIYMSLKAIKKILGNEINIIIHDFIKKEILHRGFIFKCEKCKYTGWYDIEDVDNKFKCRRCRKIQYYNSKHLTRQNPVEPEWFYKLDEAIYQGYDNDMIVPILTLYKLKRLSKESFLYINEVEIRKKENPEKQHGEIDICCIHDGKIIIGECKIHNKLKRKEIEKYRDIYNEIGADKIIFSTFNEKGWSEGTLNIFKEILGEKINYTTFNKKDLLS